MVFLTSLSWIVKTFSFELKLAGQAKVFLSHSLWPIREYAFLRLCVSSLRILFAKHFKFVSGAVPLIVLHYLLFCWNVVYRMQRVHKGVEWSRNTVGGRGVSLYLPSQLDRTLQLCT